MSEDEALALADRIEAGDCDDWLEFLLSVAHDRKRAVRSSRSARIARKRIERRKAAS